MPEPTAEERKQRDAESVSRFRHLVEEAVPAEATVMVVSKGDHRLLELGDERTGWHFPQRSDGVYAGFHPHDDDAAIAHLEALRERGGEFIAFPPPSVWWLEHYARLASYLEERYRLVVRDLESGVVLDVRQPDRSDGNEGAGGSGPAEEPDEPSEQELLELFSPSFYGGQAGRSFASAEEGLHHYMESGHRRGLDPHPLFSTAWYARRYLRGDDEQIPLVHFLKHSADELQDPSPYFDTDYYYAQAPQLRERKVNGLLHYIRTAANNQSSHPNALFRDGYYLRTYPDALSGSATPLEHYLASGYRDGYFASEFHQNIMGEAQRSAPGLLRGRWTLGTVIYLMRGGTEPTTPVLMSLAEELQTDHHLGAVVVALTTPGAAPSEEGEAEVLVLEDYELVAEVLRPAAVRLLARSLASLRPAFAVTDSPAVARPLREAGVGVYLIAEGVQPEDAEEVIEAAEDARRVLVPSSPQFKALAKAGKRFPVNATLFPGRGLSAAERLLELASRDFHLPLRAAESVEPSAPTRKVLMLCSDWSVSGVNASLEGIGGELRRRGWDVEILFTRDEEFVRETGEGGSHMPELPHRYLAPAKRGLTGMWEALIAELQASGPCIVFMAYDFVANAVVPALTDDVGAVIWMQADDGDYYEQAYRLGPYCNALVCVSQHIRDRVADLNPAFEDRAHVVHNSSVRSEDIIGRRPRRRRKLRLVYTGRLVQYQKRVLDYVALAEALDQVGVPYEISLIGSFSAHDKTEAAFESLAGEHLANGRIRLLGRMNRDEVFEQLAGNDLFVLLSEFEGLPLALVEAMARGCVPVVAGSPSGIPEIVTTAENGFILETRDYSEWAVLIADLWNDPRRLARMSKNARATVRDRFTVETVGADMDAVFARVAEECHGGTRARPEPLHWGAERSQAGDVLPPPSLIRPSLLRLPGLA